MHQADPVTGLTSAEAALRRGLLEALRAALAQRRVDSAVAGRRTLVLRSARGGIRYRRYRQLLTDPQLYVFIGGGVDVVTTDGRVYRLPGGREFPVADPERVARVYGRSRRRPG